MTDAVLGDRPESALLPFSGAKSDRHRNLEDMGRRIFIIVAALIATLSFALALTTNWAYSETLNTSKFVHTADTLLDDPLVQEELATTIVDSLAGDSPLPPILLAPLTRTATAIVASPTFQTFWSDAISEIHPQLVTQLQSDTPIDRTSALRVDLTEMVNAVLLDLRTQFPRAAGILPTTAPLVEFELVDGENLESGRQIVGTVNMLRWVLAIITVALLSLLAFLSRRSGHLTRTPAIVVSAGAFITLITAIAIPSVAQSLADNEYAQTARNVGTSLASSLQSQAIVLLIIGLATFCAPYIRQRGKRKKVTQ
jgi:hypothetical protein